MKTNFTVHGIYKCQLEFVNCTETDKKIRKKEIKVFHCIYCKEQKLKKKQKTQQKTTKQNENKGWTFQINSFPGMKMWVFVNSGNLFLYVIN